MRLNLQLKRKQMKILGLAIWIALTGLSALAETGAAFPSKTIRLIIPFAPGGVTDTSGRIIADFMSKHLGQQVIPDNRPGASGNIGSQYVTTLEPDGYNLLLVLDGTFVINPHVYDKLGFNPLKDFSPIGKIGDSTVILVAHPGLKAKNLQDVLTFSKLRPEGLSFGTSGTASIVHIAGELLKQRTGANLVHVPYKGGGPAVADVLGGHIPLAFASAASIHAHLKSGKLVPIGVPSLRRSKQFPDIPTFSESGVPDFNVNSWVALVAPAKTPKAIVDKLNNALNAALNDNEVREKLAVAGIVATPGSPEVLGDIIKNEYLLYGQVVKSANIKAD